MTDSERTCLDAFLSSYGKPGETYAYNEWLTELNSFIEGWIWAKTNTAKNETPRGLIEDVETDAKGRG